jgi:hypothetical protein
MTTKPTELSDQTSTPPRATVLDESKRAIVLGMLANGSSRRIAARVVGCAPSTITRTATRDPEFSLRLARAEQNVEMEALRTLRKAAKKQRYWRAAVWLLERKNPEDFTPRPATTYSPESVMRLMNELAILVAGDMSDDECSRAIQRMDEVLARLGIPRRPSPDADSAELTEEFLGPAEDTRHANWDKPCATGSARSTPCTTGSASVPSIPAQENNVEPIHLVDPVVLDLLKSHLQEG